MARPTLDRNPKFKGLVRRLGIPRPHARGYLELMWDAANESGNPLFASAATVEDAAEWDGEPGRLASVLVDVGFLDELADGRLEVHDYWQHAPAYVRKRREREDARCQKSTIDQSVTSQRQTTAADDESTADNGTPPSPSPSPSTEDASASSARTRPEPGPGPAPTPADETVLEFPLHQRGRTWPLTAAKLAQYRESFPHLDVLAVLREGRQWLVDNPGKRKTANGMPRFCSGWLAREQNRGRGGGPAARPRPAVDGPSNDDLKRLVGWT